MLSNENDFGSSSFANKNILFRDKEREQLINIFGPPTSLSYPCTFIYGQSSVGKTLVIKELLNELKYPNAWINCRELTTLSTMLSSIIDQVQSVCKLDLPDTSCSTLCDLVNFFKHKLKNFEETIFLVFDNAEVLRTKFPTVFSALLRLQEITKINITTIFISDVVWEKFRGNAGLFEPITIHFSDYNKEQLIDILCLDRPDEYSKEFYEGYANIILKVFYVVTRDLNELRHVARLNFVKYCEPLSSGDLNETNTLKLFRNIEPTLKEAIHAVYLREVSGPKWLMLLKADDDNKLENDQPSSTITKFRLSKELPFYTKFLLLASYFASYNSPKSDFKHFVKNQGKQKKKSIRKKMEKNRHLLGPKPFTMDRMLSIFFSIIGHGVMPSALILSQVSSLCSLQLLIRVSMEEQLDVPKYKCLAELDLVRCIGKTVNIDVMNYLDDFI